MAVLPEGTRNMKCSRVALTLVLAVLGWASTAPMAAHTLDATATVAEENQPASETASSDDGQMEENAEYDQADETPTATVAEENQPANAEESADNCPVEHVRPSCLESANYGWWPEAQAAAKRWIGAWLSGCIERPVVYFRTARCSISQRIARIDWAALVAGQTQDREVWQTTPGVEPVQR
jgi:hypothetical protein